MELIFSQDVATRRLPSHRGSTRATQDLRKKAHEERMVGVRHKGGVEGEGWGLGFIKTHYLSA